MTEDEYRDYFDQLLKSFGGSFDAPSGWGGDGKTLYYSCTHPPIDVPMGQHLNSDQRRVIVERAKAKYKIV